MKPGIGVVPTAPGPVPGRCPPYCSPAGVVSALIAASPPPNACAACMSMSV